MYNIFCKLDNFHFPIYVLSTVILSGTTWLVEGNCFLIKTIKNMVLYIHTKIAGSRNGIEAPYFMQGDHLGYLEAIKGYCRMPPSQGLQVTVG